MFRLRTTVCLSLLALAIGVAGTAWLSAFTSDWQGPAGAASASSDKVRRILRRHTRAPAAREPAAPTTTARTRIVAAAVRTTDELPTLTPIDMPSLATPWLQRAVFASGRVVLKLSIDGEGRVGQAAVAESSGNAGLDDRALRTATRWRFAVPGDHPNGLMGQLVMRFDDTPTAAPL
jgi:protein TonB